MLLKQQQQQHKNHQNYIHDHFLLIFNGQNV
jgi:hypothetical protein